MFPVFDIDHTVMGTLGIEIFEYTPERVVARMPVTPKVHQPFGLLHGAFPWSLPKQ
jgi:uncharacterized protein (TIGR00369 family)